MRFRFGASLVAVAVTLIVPNGSAQEVPNSVGDHHRVIPFKESLQAKGIGLSHASFVAALHNQDPPVRSQAANVLAENRDPEAAQLIEGALASERDPQTMVDLASVLMGMGDETGTNRLVEICTSDSLSNQTVTYAIFHLVLRGAGAQCIDKLIERLKYPGKVDSAVEMIARLGQLYRVASPEQKTQFLTTLQPYLIDTNFETRMAASRALAQTASPSASNSIKAALQRETDPIVRSSMQSDLHTLEKP
jgi:HEAT repeat protein